MLKRSSDNMILRAYRDHRDHDAEYGPEPDMALHPFDQWVHWLEQGNQEVTDDREEIAQANLLFARLESYIALVRAECPHLTATNIPMEDEDDTYICDACGAVWCEANGEDPNRG